MIRLLELRTERGLSQRAMAKILNISQGTYNNWENSNTQPSIEQLIDLARFFGVSVDYLIGYSDEFGAPDDKPLTRRQRDTLKLFEAADPVIQEAVVNILTKTGKVQK